MPYHCEVSTKTPQPHEGSILLFSSSCDIHEFTTYQPFILQLTFSTYRYNSILMLLELKKPVKDYSTGPATPITVELIRDLQLTNDIF